MKHAALYERLEKMSMAELRAAEQAVKQANNQRGDALLLPVLEGEQVSLGWQRNGMPTAQADLMRKIADVEIEARKLAHTELYAPPRKISRTVVEKQASRFDAEMKGIDEALNARDNTKLQTHLDNIVGRVKADAAADGIEHARLRKQLESTGTTKNVSKWRKAAPWVVGATGLAAGGTALALAARRRAAREKKESS